MTVVKREHIKTINRIYDLGPTLIHVEAEYDDLIIGFDRFLDERRLKDTSTRSRVSTFNVTIRIGELKPHPADCELLFKGKMLVDGECEFARKAETYFLTFPDEACMVIDLEGRRAEIIVTHDHRHRAQGCMVPIIIEYALDREGQQVVHAAGLSLPDDKGMVLISAASNTGKTTTSLALAKCGLKFAADDVMVLRRELDGVVSWGLPRWLHVHRKTAEMLPWLELEPKWNKNEEQMVTRRELASKLDIENSTLPVTCLIHLKRGEKAAIEPIEATDMLVHLAEDNVRGSPTGLTSLQANRFTMLADLVEAVPAYCVTIGEGLLDIETIARDIKNL